MLILSGRTAEYFNRPQDFGVMLSYKQTGREIEALDDGCRWMLDNGAFSGNFDLGNWEKRLKKFAPYRETCLGVILPDHVIFKNGKFAGGDWRKTLELADLYAPIVRSLGLPIAYALQNDHDPDQVPYDLFDTLFIGGKDEYRYSEEVQRICLTAKSKGKRVHFGRISSYKNMMRVWFADSVDSTAFIWDTEYKVGLVLKAKRDIQQQPRLIGI